MRGMKSMVNAHPEITKKVNLERELDYAYSLIVKRFGIAVEFDKPKVLVGDEAKGRDHSTFIFLFNHNVDNDYKTNRLINFAHRLPHFLMPQLNHDLRDEAIQTASKAPLRLFKASVATYMGIEACKESNFSDLVKD